MLRVVKRMAKLALTVPLLVACATAAPGEPLVRRPTIHIAAAAAPRADAAEPAYRARVSIRFGREQQFDNWIDIVVLGTTEGARSGCSLLVQRELRLASPPGARKVLDRDCSSSLLPAAVRAMGAMDHVLVHREDVTVALAMESTLSRVSATERPTLEPEVPSAQLTHFTRYASKAECERTRKELEKRILDTWRAGQDAGREWLDAQIQKLEEERDTKCRSYEVEAKRCTELVTRSDFEHACQNGAESAACKSAQNKVLDMEICSIEAKMTARDCRNYEELIKMLRARTPEPVVPKPMPYCMSGGAER
jgi:hypothetical protein